MARPTTIKGSQLVIEVGDGATPEIFSAPCALTTKGITFNTGVNEQNVPDCDDPDAPTWTERTESTRSATITGSGTLAMESFHDVWQPWTLSGGVKNVRFRFVAPAAQGGGHYEMAAVLTTCTFTGVNGELATIEVELSSSGEVTWVDAT